MEKQKEFSIGTILKIVLDGPHYFNAYDVSREIRLMSKKLFDKEFNISSLQGFAREGRIKELGWIEIPHTIVGKCVGSRQDCTKLKPFYGIMHWEAEYFLLSSGQITSIMELRPIVWKIFSSENAGYSQHFFLYKNIYIINNIKVNILYKQAVCCLRKSAESSQFFCYFCVWVYT